MIETKISTASPFNAALTIWQSSLLIQVGGDEGMIVAKGREVLEHINNPLFSSTYDLTVANPDVEVAPGSTFAPCPGNPFEGKLKQAPSSSRY